ncbi:hypothetical protein [Clostridium sp.]|uniref:hypothetical protein n=1 Tax=Clostridium sp. TaxID=1506 RepID=UPI003464E13C
MQIFNQDWIAEEKEHIKEVYKEWKELQKKAPAPKAEEKEETSQELIRTVVGLSAGTMATIAKEAGIIEKDSTVTYDMVWH